MSPRLTESQRRAVFSRGRDLCVVAGAGAGKTRVLTERVVERVREGAELTRLLAITFTEKAAAEMKQRLAEALLESGRPAAREEVEGAPISTVHAFCARLLREHAVEADVDPAFAVLDEYEADTVLRATLRALVAEIAAESPEVLEALAALPGGDPDDVVLDAYDAARASGRGVAEFVTDVRGLPSRRAAFDPLQAALTELELAAGGATGAARARADDVLAAGRLLPDPEDALDRIVEAVTAVEAAVNLRCGGPVKDALKEVRDAAQRVMSILAEECLRPLRAHLGSVLARLDELYRAAKGDGELLDFCDLELRAVALLTERPDVRAAVQGRFDDVLVDEYQDTNPLQARLVELVRRPSSLFVVGDPKQSIYGFRGADVDVFLERLQRSTEDDPEGVVDMTQSFRARPELTGFVNAVFAGGISPGDAEREIPAVPYAALVAAAPFATATVPAVEVLKLPCDGAEDGRRGEFAWIAARIAEMVEGDEPLPVRDATPDDPSRARPAGFGDVAVLLRAMGDVKLLERELTAHDVPYVVVKGRGFWEAREVADLANLLACVDNPADDLTLAAVLRSPAAGLDDDALFALTDARGEGPLVNVLWRVADGERLPGLERVADVERFAAVLAELRRVRGRDDLPALVRRAVEATDLETLALARPNGRQRAANLRKVRDLALTRARSGDGELRDFVARMRELRQRQVRETEAPVAGAVGGAVSILTVHAAKGLEFPVVFVPDLGRAAHTPTGALLFRASDGVGLKSALPGHPLEGSVPFLYARLRTVLRERELAESQRLLYVAMTRAADHLCLTASLARSGSRPWWDRVCAALPADAWPTTEPRDVDIGAGADADARTRTLVRLQPPLRPAAAAGRPRSLMGQAAAELLRGEIPAYPAGADAAGREVAEREAERILSESETPFPGQDGALYAATVSGLVTFARCPEEFRRRHVLGLPEETGAPPRGVAPGPRPDRGAGDDDEWGVPLDQRARGRAAHALLERLVPAFAEDPAPLALAALEEETGGAAPDPAAVDTLVSWVRGFQHSDLGRELASVPRERVRREQSLLFRVGRTVVRGQLDLVFRGADGWTIVDYKAGRLEGSQTDYELQMRLYALALEAVTGEPPARVVLFSLPRAHPVEVTAGRAELDALRTELLRPFLARTSARDFAPAGAPPCASCAYRQGCAFVA